MSGKQTDFDILMEYGVELGRCAAARMRPPGRTAAVRFPGDGARESFAILPSSGVRLDFAGHGDDREAVTILAVLDRFSMDGVSRVFVLFEAVLALLLVLLLERESRPDV